MYAFKVGMLYQDIRYIVYTEVCLSFEISGSPLFIIILVNK